MKLYLDSADIADWTDLSGLGIFCGITTNPTLAARAGLDYPAIDWADMAGRAADLGMNELHGQVYGDPGGYLAFAERLFEAGDARGITTVVKIPMTEAGLRTVPKVTAMGRPVLLTACYHAKQMVTAQALGATYIAPYVGRMRDNGLDAPGHLRQMVAIGKSAARPTCILAASIRSSAEVLEIIGCGVDTMTISAAVARDLVVEKLTADAVAEFERQIGG